MSSFLSAASQQQQKQKRKLSGTWGEGLKLSINAVTTYRWSFEEDVVRYRLAGIEAIGLWLPKLLEYGEERGAELLEENGLAVSSLSWAGGFTGAFGHELDDVLAETRELIRLAGRLHAGSLIVVTGPKNNHLNKHANRLLVDSLKELADEAAENDVLLSLQPMRPEFEHSWTFLHKLDHALEVLDRVNHSAVQLAFDTYHLGHEPGLLQRLPELVPHIGVLQVSDARSKVADEYDRVLPGEGVLPVEAIVSGVIDAGYRGFVDYQIWSDDCWRSDDLSWLQRCRDNFGWLCPVCR
ncbi:MAG TPA: sugar phosphate isomerase/epimerase family protein [Planctomycetaceae bacterium]|nr:sugar phosphate isomerase/epimerase family protein [Planctomycetaceae bacterium]